jgi:hypothetical protein
MRTKSLQEQKSWNKKIPNKNKGMAKGKYFLEELAL